jgi:hypothetical protein
MTTATDPIKVKDFAKDLEELTKDSVPSLSEDIKEFEEHVTMRSGKESEPIVPRSEKEYVTEIPTKIETEKQPEVDVYVKSIEKEIQLEQPIIDDYTKNVLLYSPTNQKPKITLPLTEDQIEKGLHHHVWEAITWLAVWCKRQLEKLV